MEASTICWQITNHQRSSKILEIRLIWQVAAINHNVSKQIQNRLGFTYLCQSYHKKKAKVQATINQNLCKNHHKVWVRCIQKGEANTVKIWLKMATLVQIELQVWFTVKVRNMSHFKDILHWLTHLGTNHLAKVKFTQFQNPNSGIKVSQLIKPLLQTLHSQQLDSILSHKVI